MLTQDLLHHLRHGLVLKESALAGVRQQRQMGTEHHLIMRLVGGGGNPLQACDDTVHRLAAAHAQGGELHQNLFRRDVNLRGGKVDFPSERFAERLAALKAQHVGRDGGVVDFQGIAGLSVEKCQPVVHNKDLILLRVKSGWLHGEDIL
ncbi:hypothetical protein D3C80_910010 [compost metagenome]